MRSRSGLIASARMRAGARHALLLALFTLADTGTAATPPGFALEPRFLATPPVSDAPGFVAEGCRALFLPGEPAHGAPTRVFAWYGAPRVGPGVTVPAVVLLHGGGGTAFDAWVRLWVGRGYAAIAIDHCGQLPIREQDHWQRDPQGGPPGDWVAPPDGPASEDWQHHALAGALHAHSLLRSFPEVDATRIGVIGISWGGYLTCLVAGIDQRFRFAVPVYGCGFLADDSVWLPDFARLGAARAAAWTARWDPSRYLPAATMPMLWVTGTNDPAFPMDSLQRSYRLPEAPRTICLTLRMPHGHGGAGEKPEEIHAFADAIVKQGVPPVRLAGHPTAHGVASADYTAGVALVRAELCLTTDAGPWKERAWTTLPATIDARAKTISAPVPAQATAWYLNVTDARGLVTSTEHETR